MVEVVAATVPGRVWVKLTDFDGTFGECLDDVADRVASNLVSCELWSERVEGRGYYPNVCFKLSLDRAGDEIEVADGGAVRWTQALLDNRKERLMIGGLSLERLASIAQ